MSSVVHKVPSPEAWLRRGYLKRSYNADMEIFHTRNRKLLLALFILAILLLPFVVSKFTVNVLNLIALATLGALGLNLLIGVAGQIAIGSAAFLAIGSVGAVVFGRNLGLPFILVIPLSALCAATVGAVIGIPALRLRGLYLLMATMALHFIVNYAFNRYQSAAVGEVGFVLPRANLFGWTLQTPQHWYYVLVGVSAVAAIAVTNLLRSRFGRAWRAIHHRDIAAEIIGINVPRAKIQVFMVSAALTGVQGALLAYYMRIVSSDAFTFDVAVQYIAMIIIGGLGSVLGSYLGAVFVIGLPFLLQGLAEQLPKDSGLVGHLLASNIFELQTVVYGVAIIAFLLMEPRGLAYLWIRLTTYFRLWPFRKERVMSSGA